MNNIDQDTIDDMLLAFYADEAPDIYGRKISDIWKFTDEEIESTHNFIQWIFPLEEPSGLGIPSPVLTPTDRIMFKSNETLQTNMIKSLDRYLDFLGMERNGNSIKVMDDVFEKNKFTWITHGNHNYLRITRVLTSLRLCGQQKLAEEFFERLFDLRLTYAPRFGESYGYWQEAMQ